MEQTIYDKAISQAGIQMDDTVLVLCGGSYDRATFLKAGHKNVVISNLDPHAGVTDYEPYRWERQDAEAISYDNESFDWCVVHAGLHHCGSPHWALCEMLRVARKGVIVVEAADNTLMRFGVWLGLTEDYELTPALLSEGKSGGYRNTKIPNYVYRWTEREIEKTVKSFMPERSFDAQYIYDFRIPLQRIATSRNIVKRLVASVASGMISALRIAAPKQGNSLAFIIKKRAQLQDWLMERDGELEVNLDYLSARMDASKYKRGNKTS